MSRVDDKCPNCDGRGWQFTREEDADMLTLGAMLCPTCDGNGTVGDDHSDIFSIGDAEDD